MRVSLGLFGQRQTAGTTVRVKAVLRATEMKMCIARANAKPSAAFGTVSLVCV